MVTSTKAFYRDKNLIPWGGLLFALGLYTCKKWWKELYKIRVEIDFSETSSKWLKKGKLTFTTKNLPPRSCLPLPLSYIHVKIVKKNDIKSEFKLILLKFTANDRRNKSFYDQLGVICLLLLGYIHVQNSKEIYIRSKNCLPEVFCPWPGLLYM